jgi:hypothetical protein
MRYLAAILFALVLAIPAISVELFRYQGAAKDGGLAGSLLNPGSAARSRLRARWIRTDVFLVSFDPVRGDSLLCSLEIEPPTTNQ